MTVDEAEDFKRLVVGKKLTWVDENGFILEQLHCLDVIIDNNYLERSLVILLDKVYGSWTLFDGFKNLNRGYWKFYDELDHLDYKIMTEIGRIK